MLASALPYWPIAPSLAKNPWHNFQLDLARCLWAVLPAALLWGASFPLALAAAAGKGGDSGRLVGSVYAANTVGAIAGALVFSVLLVGWIGTQHSQQILILVAALSALIAIAPLLLPRRGEAQTAGPLAGALLTAALGLAGWL